MSRPIRFIAAIVFAVAMLLPGTALAAPATWESIDITVHNDQGQSKLLISGTLPAATKLPAEVELAVPAGSQMQWSGEILGGPVEQDPTVQTTKTTKGTQDIYRFTLTKARVGQLEVTAPGILAQQGADSAVTLKYAPSQDVPTVNLNVRIPRTSRVLQEVPGASMQGGSEANWGYYTKAFTGAKAGQELDLTFTYSAPAPAAAAPAGAKASSTLLGTLIVLLAAAGLGALLMSVSRKMKTAQPETVESSAPARKRAAATTVVEDEDVDDAFHAEDDEEEAEEAPARKKPAKKAAVQTEVEAEVEPRRGLNGPQKVALVGAVAAVALIVALMSQQNSSDWVDGKLTKNFGTLSACTAVSMPVTPPQGKTLEDVGPAMLKSLNAVGGLRIVTIDSGTSKINVEFCESSTNEGAIRQALATTGVQLGEGTVGVPSDAAAPAPTPGAAPVAPGAAPASATPIAQ